jgi:hypothetical protein
MASLKSRPEAGYLFSVLAGFLVVMAIVAIFDNTLGSSVAPKISKSISFNQKAAWLKHIKTCDVLIIGSSIGMNNIDGVAIQEHFPRRSIVNAASWGLSVEESGRILDILGSRCMPKVVIFPLYFGDFTSEEGDKAINWNWFAKYLGSGRTILESLGNFDLFYFAETYFTLQSAPYSNNRYYTSLKFDRTGSVMLSSHAFLVDSRRWNAYQSRSAEQLRAAQFEALARIVETARKSGIKLILLETPFTKAANQYFAESGDDLGFDRIAGIADKGDTEIIDSRRYNFEDALFTDYCHLNESGALALTQLTYASIHASLD